MKAPITVAVRIDFEDEFGGPIAVAHEFTRRWDLETMEYTLAEQTAALQTVDRSDVVIVTAAYSEMINGRRLLIVRASKAKPSSLAALELAFAQLDPELWSQKLLHGNIAVTVGACPLSAEEMRDDEIGIVILQGEPS
jgi:hypothetical protein